MLFLNRYRFLDFLSETVLNVDAKDNKKAKHTLSSTCSLLLAVLQPLFCPQHLTDYSVFRPSAPAQFSSVPPHEPSVLQSLYSKIALFPENMKINSS